MLGRDWPVVDIERMKAGYCVTEHLQLSCLPPSCDGHVKMGYKEVETAKQVHQQCIPSCA